jgi:hypothetical protein
MSIFERYGIDRDVLEYAINKKNANLIMLHEDTGEITINANRGDIVIIIGHNSGIVKLCSKSGPPESYIWTTGNPVICEY